MDQQLKWRDDVTQAFSPIEMRRRVQTSVEVRAIWNTHFLSSAIVIALSYKPTCMKLFSVTVIHEVRVHDLVTQCPSESRSTESEGLSFHGLPKAGLSAEKDCKWRTEEEGWIWPSDDLIVDSTQMQPSAHVIFPQKNVSKKVIYQLSIIIFLSSGSRLP